MPIDSVSAKAFRGRALLGGGVAAVLIGGAVAVAVAATDDDATASFVQPVMDEGILDFEFVGSMFDSGYSDPVVLNTEEDALTGDVEFAPSGVLPQFIMGEPQYGDFDGDLDLDAALLIAPYAGGGTPSLYLWLWEDGEVVQVPHPAAVGEDCGDHIDQFTVVDNAIEVEMTTGWWCDGTMDPQPVEFTVAVQDGFPVQVDPGFGSPYRCPEDQFDVIAEPETAELYVASSAGSPQIDLAAVSRIEVLERGTADGLWWLARVTGPDDVVNCAWTPRH